jgi:hypothetical protein
MPASQALRLVFLIAIGLVVTTSVFPQGSGTAGQSKRYDSGQKPWVVTKGKIGDLKNKSAIIEDYNTEKEAQDRVAELRKAEKFSSPWYYDYRKRSADDPRPAVEPLPKKDAKIEIEKPKTPLAKEMQDELAALEASYKNILKLQNGLQSSKGVEKAQIDALNRLIDAYNARRKAFTDRFGQPPMGLPELQRLGSADATKKTPAISGKFVVYPYRLGNPYVAARIFLIREDGNFTYGEGAKQFEETVTETEALSRGEKALQRMVNNNSYWKWKMITPDTGEVRIKLGDNESEQVFSFIMKGNDQLEVITERVRIGELARRPREAAALYQRMKEK